MLKTKTKHYSYPGLCIVGVHWFSMWTRALLFSGFEKFVSVTHFRLSDLLTNHSANIALKTGKPAPRRSRSFIRENNRL